MSTALQIHEPAELEARGGETLPARHEVGFAELLAMAEALVPTGFLPDHIKTPGQAVAIILTGRELGMPPMRALRSLQMVKGKVVENADSQLARFKSDGGRAIFRVLSETEAELWLRHPNGDEHVERFTIEDAERAGLTKPSSRGEPSMYLKHPKAMLRSRVITAGLKSIGWEGGAGAYDPDEALAFAPELRAGLEHADPAATTAPTPTVATDVPPCPKCGGRMWDNRVGKRNEKAPDFKCRNRSCEGVYWPGQWPPKPRASEEQIEALLTLTDRADCPEKVRTKIRSALETGITAEKAEKWIAELSERIDVSTVSDDEEESEGASANPQSAPATNGSASASSERSAGASEPSSASNGNGARAEPAESGTVDPDSRAGRTQRIRALLEHPAVAKERDDIKRRLVNGMTDRELLYTLRMLERATAAEPPAPTKGGKTAQAFGDPSIPV